MSTVDPRRSGPLAGVVVLEIAEGVAGPLAGLHCELLGAHVVKVELGEGDPARAWGDGSVFRLLNSGKQMLRTELAELVELPMAVGHIDAVIADRRPEVEHIVRSALADRGLRSIVLIDHDAVPGGWRSSETTVQAAAAYTNYLGWQQGRPARVGADLAWSTAGLQAVQATLAHLHTPTADPVAIVSPMRAALTDKTIQLASRSDPATWTGYHVLAGERPPDRGYLARDGRLSFEFPPDRHQGWQEFCRSIGYHEIVDDPDWCETTGMGSRADARRSGYEEHLQHLDRDELIDVARANGGWAVPFLSGTAVRAHPQTVEYGAVAIREGAALLRSPWRVNGAPIAERAIGEAFGPAPGAATGPPDREASDPVPGLPLAGLRVVDLGIGGVGPWAGSQLAQLGGSVVKIEAPNEFILDVMPPWRTATTSYAALNVGKSSIRLNLKDLEDREIAWELIERADVIIENFRSGAMDRLGFGYDAVAARNARIVYCTSNGFGSGGPLAGLPCTDPHMQAFSGASWLNGHEAGGERLRYYGSVDLFTSGVVVEGILAALLQRQRTGQPQHVEVTMLAAATTMCLSQWAEDLWSGYDSGPVGSRGRHTHPDGLYRTADRPIALTVATDAEFHRFCDVIGRPELAGDRRFATSVERRGAADDLDAEIEAALRTAPADWWLIQLRRADIASGPCNTERALLDHRDSWAQHHLRELDDPDAEHADRMIVAGTPWDLASTVPTTARAPLPGEHTEEVRSSGDRWHAIEAILARRSSLVSDVEPGHPAAAHPGGVR